MSICKTCLASLACLGASWPPDIYKCRMCSHLFAQFNGHTIEIPKDCHLYFNAYQLKTLHGCSDCFTLKKVLKELSQ